MSFTNEELQSFNTILEQKLSQQRRELERSFDQRLQVVKREIEQRLLVTQKDFMRVLTQHLSDQYRQLKELIHQGNTAIAESTANVVEATPDLSQMELDTEIPLDDLAEAINEALDDRFCALDTSFKATIKGIEQHLTTELQSLRTDSAHSDPDAKGVVSITEITSLDGTVSNMQDIFTSIERLEHIIESMQVAMTSNSALLSNRLYHHQQLPLERAHPSNTELQR